MENEVFSEKEYYRKKIIEMVEKIDSLNILISIFSFIKGILSTK